MKLCVMGNGGIPTMDSEDISFIKSSYKEAADKKKQIKILAELLDTSEREILKYIDSDAKVIDKKAENEKKVMAMLEAGVRQCDISRELHADSHYVSNIAAKARKLGVSTQKAKPRRGYDDDFKRKVAEEYKLTGNARATSKKFGVHETTVTKWARDFSEDE